MTIRKISDHKTKDGLKRGLAQWVINGVTRHCTEEEAKSLDKSKRKEEEPVNDVTVDNVAEVNVDTRTVAQKALAEVTGPYAATANEVASAIGHPVPSVRRTLNQLAKNGAVQKTGNKYLAIA